MVVFEKAPPEALQLLQTPIRDLGLRIEETPLYRQVEQLYRELEQKGIHHFRPPCYLSDEWGCPSGEPVIGVPFYLADRRTAHLENELNDIESEREVMMYLRHEAGHAFNYAYELFTTDEWTGMFGPFRRAYRDDFKFVPFSRDYVRHIAGWYAQKHPDEDFAESFAVWLDPSSHWRARYRGWGAIRKIEYVDRIAATVGDQRPLRANGTTDVTVNEMEQTVEEYYREMHSDESEIIASLALDTDLTDIFMHPSQSKPEMELVDAVTLVSEHRRDLVDKVNYWTGVRRTLVRALVAAIEQRVRELGLIVPRHRSRAAMIDLTVYVSTLSMSFLTGGKPLRHRVSLMKTR